MNRQSSKLLVFLVVNDARPSITSLWPLGVLLSLDTHPAYRQAVIGRDLDELSFPFLRTHKEKILEHFKLTMVAVALLLAIGTGVKESSA